MPQSSKTPAEWMKLALQGSQDWNQEVVRTADWDFIDFRVRNQQIVPFLFKDFKFPMEVDFSGVEFSEGVSFNDIQFEKRVNFSGAQFGPDAIFHKTEFKGEVTFCHAKFHGNASFQETVFYKKASFDRAVFSKTAHFFGAKFKHWAQFSCAKFEGPASFRTTEFAAIANFHGVIFHEAPFFHGADIDGRIRFDHVTDFDRQFLDLGGSAEFNYRELKVGMKRIEAHAEENAFFRLEMLTRKSQEPWPRKGLYWLYEFISDYGQSIILPAIWLGVFFLVFLWFYHLFPQSIGLGEGYGGYVNALHLALKGAFVLPGMFSGGALEKIQLSGLGIILAGVHWLLSAASWFLMLLGLRNRFRLK